MCVFKLLPLTLVSTTKRHCNNAAALLLGLFWLDVEAIRGVGRLIAMNKVTSTRSYSRLKRLFHLLLYVTTEQKPSRAT